MKPKIRIRGIGTAVPKHTVSTKDLPTVIPEFFVGKEKYMGVLTGCAIDKRHFAVPLSEYTDFDGERGIKWKNDRYIVEAVKLGKIAVKRALKDARMKITDIDHFIVVSTTGWSNPGLDTLIAKELGMHKGIDRSTILAMGCYGSIPGLASAFNSALAGSSTSKTVLMLSVEICSACWQAQDSSLASFVSHIIFGDGAGAAILSNHDDPIRPEILDRQMYTDMDTTGLMEFNLNDTGFEIVLDKAIPKALRETAHIPLNQLLTRNRLSLEDITHWVVHPGGIRILNYLQKALGLTDAQLKDSFEVLHDYGNMSSATIFFILQRLLEGESLLKRKKTKAGDYGIIAAFGPGLTTDLILLRF